MHGSGRDGREGSGAFDSFAACVESYVELHSNHMHKEEALVLPRAQQVLGPDDWASIDAAFTANRDPLAGVDAEREMRELFRHIASLAPAPIGLGPSGS